MNEFWNDAGNAGIDSGSIRPARGPKSGRKLDRRSATPARRIEFWELVSADPGGCYWWTGPTFPNGYGNCDGELAHRVALAFGEVIPEGLVVDHTCNAPLCVRPDHLRVVEQSENLGRAGREGRMGRKGLTAERVQAIRWALRCGVPVGEVAEAEGISRAMVWNIQRGRAHARVPYLTDDEARMLFGGGES